MAAADRIALLHEAIAAAPTGVAADRARLSLFTAEGGGIGEAGG